MDNNREKIVIKTSIISILSNIVLAGFKAGVGLLANSIAVVSDAVSPSAASATNALENPTAGTMPTAVAPAIDIARHLINNFLFLILFVPSSFVYDFFLTGLCKRPSGTKN